MQGKRQVTATPSAFPLYASACSSFEKYSSACSCLGVTGSVTTVGTPLTTTTVTTSVTSTATVPTTVSTETDTSTVTTSTVSSVIATATTTVPLDIEVAVGLFYLQAVNTSNAGSYVALAPVLAGYQLLEFNPSVSAALQFFLLEGKVYSIDLPGNVIEGGSGSNAFLALGRATSVTGLVCSIDTQLLLHCTESRGYTAWNQFQVCAYSAQYKLLVLSAVSNECGSPIVGLQVVAVL